MATEAQLRKLLGPENYAQYKKHLDPHGNGGTFSIDLGYSGPTLFSIYENRLYFPEQHGNDEVDIMVGTLEGRGSERAFIVRDIEDTLVYAYSFPDRVREAMETDHCGTAYLSWNW